MSVIKSGQYHLVNQFEEICARDVHQLKCWPEYFQAIWRGDKPFEVRIDDRDYKVGDMLLLQEYESETARFTGVMLYKRITYAMRDPEFVKDGYVILGLAR